MRNDVGASQVVTEEIAFAERVGQRASIAITLRAKFMMRIRAYQPADEAAVVALWQSCGIANWEDPRKTIARKLRVNREWFLVGELDGAVIATCMVGYEGHRGWINLLAVAPAYQRSGHGRALMAEAEQILRGVGCAKINLQVRATNRAVIAFYKRLGFATENLVHLGKQMERD